MVNTGRFSQNKSNLNLPNCLFKLNKYPKNTGSFGKGKEYRGIFCLFYRRPFPHLVNGFFFGNHLIYKKIYTIYVQELKMNVHIECMYRRCRLI